MERLCARQMKRNIVSQKQKSNVCRNRCGRAKITLRGDGMARLSAASYKGTLVLFFS